ncbi:hypothetical protein K493DRAFT_297331 [Basidiobolus meristosporus CBS 931.73]|uniref:Uncharacterized protein n=1 Tax=Basidiobolus meristosporus CBS 931.73 TaxID=1314790 RepID=A0A1Y1Z080_9FUNG|nr:hypothetical protein K493DRAFT_297331 [Basidiobolus meristosporus CBS 931.73]|eukprot:ORY03713.1 hypothetical protein K493DRAFT_297331 [Basidiobolus meristosporus CBS 931.73]
MAFIIVLVLLLLLIVCIIICSSRYYKRNFQVNPGSDTVPVMVWRPNQSVNELHETPPQYSAQPNAHQICPSTTVLRNDVNVIEMNTSNIPLTPPPLYESRAPSYRSQMPLPERPAILRAETSLEVGRPPPESLRSRLPRSQTSTRIQVYTESLY